MAQIVNIGHRRTGALNDALRDAELTAEERQRAQRRLEDIRMHPNQEPGQRKVSVFMITFNPNIDATRSAVTDTEIARYVDHVMDRWFREDNITNMFEFFNPQDDQRYRMPRARFVERNYSNDSVARNVTSIRIEGVIERAMPRRVGPEDAPRRTRPRVHAHTLVTVHHNSYLRINLTFLRNGLREQMANTLNEGAFSAGLTWLVSTDGHRLNRAGGRIPADGVHNPFVRIRAVKGNPAANMREYVRKDVHEKMLSQFHDPSQAFADLQILGD